HHFGEVFEPNQASNVNDLELGGVRLFACAGANGDSYYRDPGDAEWTQSFFGNGGLLPGSTGQMALWTGSRWVVGTNGGVFLSSAGHEPWTPASSGPTGVNWTTFAGSGQDLSVAFSFFNGAVFATSSDEGTNWVPVDILPGKFIYRIAQHGNDFYAAQVDGLWQRGALTAAVAQVAATADLAFALVGPQPVRDAIRFRFQLAEAGDASIDIFDVLGRVAAPRIRGSWSAGSHEVPFNARALAPGVYAARLVSGNRSAVVRVVRIR
ncbi:MAG: T9SS type A sorting domain-containing protein, partial [Candidatus Eiseniibacteriota bacterium]